MSAPDAAAIREAAGPSRFPAALRTLDRVGSTNDALRAWAAEDPAPPEGATVVADSQSAGRGRRGAAWHSPPGAGLYLSVLLRPAVPAAEWPRWTIAAGLAAAEACAEAGVQAELKWPNDLLAAGRKLAGILVEARGADLVVGLGLNVRAPGAKGAPPGLAGRAVALGDLGAPAAFGRAHAAGRFLARLADADARLRAGDWAGLRAAWEARAPRIRGARVRLATGEAATTDGLDDDGALRVRRANGAPVRVLQVDGVVWPGAGGGPDDAAPPGNVGE